MAKPVKPSPTLAELVDAIGAWPRTARVHTLCRPIVAERRKRPRTNRRWINDRWVRK